MYHIYCDLEAKRGDKPPLLLDDKAVIVFLFWLKLLLLKYCYYHDFDLIPLILVITLKWDSRLSYVQETIYPK